MARPRHVYARCKSCGRSRAQVGHVSGTGLCLECGKARAHANIDQLRAHAGPAFDHWRRRCLAAFGVALEPGAPSQQPTLPLQSPDGD